MSIAKIQPWIILSLVLCLSASLLAQDFTDPKAYSNYIIAEQAKIVNENLKYIATSARNLEIRKKEAERQHIIGQLDVAIKNIADMPDFEKNQMLRETGLKVFNLYKESFSLEYQRADSMLAKKVDEEQVLQAYWEELSEVENKLLEAGKEFVKAQKAFARDFKLTKEKPFICLFSKVAEINNYYRQIYNDQLKLAEVNKDFFVALKKKHSKAMENRRKDILTISEQIMSILNETNPYEGEKTYLGQALALTQYIKVQAEGEYSKLVAINQKKHATFEDANAFNMIVVNHYRKYKVLVKKLNQAGENLIESSLEKGTKEILALYEPAQKTPQIKLTKSNVDLKAEANPQKK